MRSPARGGLLVIAVLVAILIFGLTAIPAVRGQSEADSLAAAAKFWTWALRRRSVDVYEKDRERGVAPAGAVSGTELQRLSLRPRDQGLLDPGAWPREPSSPAEIDVARFALAIVRVCPRQTTTDAAPPIAEAALRHGEAFGVDPFLLAAVVQHQSACEPSRDDDWGVGLTRIHPRIYAPDFVGRTYRHRRYVAGAFVEARIELPAVPLTREALRTVDGNLYFAAAFLSAWGAQCPHTDDLFDSAPHRHAVSHFIFGDRVRDAGPEDAIFTVRRRLLEHYGAVEDAAPAAIGSPLGGAPRLAISAPGEPRDGGRRLHRGVDFVSQEGERVVAAAAGRVIAAGLDRGPGPLVTVAAPAAAVLPRHSLGPRGLAVEILHPNGVTSLYAHLAAYKVAVGDEVEAGQLIGYVGRSGMHMSSAHLHFGVFRDGVAVDPRDHLGEQLLGPELSRHWWATVPQRLERRGLPLPYPRPTELSRGRR